jgi:hypothetical protein
LLLLLILHQLFSYHPWGAQLAWPQKLYTCLRLIVCTKLQRYNKLNGIIKSNFGKHMTTDTKFRLHNITSEASLCYCSENWITNKRDRPKNWKLHKWDSWDHY